MRRLATASILLLFSLDSPASLAGEAEARNTAEALLLLTGAEQSLAGMRSQMTREIEAETASLEVAPEIRDRMNGLRERLLEFYRSPLGRAYLERMPILMTRSMELGRSRSRRIQAKIREIIREFLEGVHDEPGDSAKPADDAT